MGSLFGKRATSETTSTTRALLPAEGIAVREISAGEKELIQKAYDLITGGSWTQEEKEGFDLEGELNDPETYRAGIFNGGELIGFGAASTLATPDFSKYPQHKDMWCGYFVLDKRFRDTLRAVSQFRELHDRLLAHALKSDKERILSCTENTMMVQVLPRLGWKFVEETDIIDKNGKHIGRTNVFEYPRRK